MQLHFKNQKSMPSQKTGGTMYYLFFNDGKKSFKTCIDSGYRNYPKWKKLIENISRGDIVLGLRITQSGLIDADSNPRYGGNIYKN
tara:strand:- start:5002 stop:5259 length:258 start_codon:yes stop_codon:yes gene_type:complete